MLIAQAVALDEKFNLADYEFAVVTLEENSGARSIGASEKAIQTFDTTDGVTVATTILPFKVLEDGEIVNSFEYAENVSSKTRASDFTATFVDITVTSIAYYETVVSSNNNYYYRHKGVSAYWSTNDSVANLHELNVVYKTCGSLYYYTGYELGNKESDNKAVSSTVVKTYPEVNAIFSNYDNATPSNKVFVMGSDIYGSWITVTVTFYADGKTQKDRADFTVY